MIWKYWLMSCIKVGAKVTLVIRFIPLPCNLITAGIWTINNNQQQVAIVMCFNNLFVTLIGINIKFSFIENLLSLGYIIHHYTYIQYYTSIIALLTLDHFECRRMCRIGEHIICS